MGLKAGLSLPDLNLSVPRGYLFLKNGVWGLTGLFTAAALFFGWSRALQWTDFTLRSWPVAASITLVMISVTFWVTSSKSVQAYYRETNV